MTKIKKWKVLEERDISPSHWFPLRVAKVKLPDGMVVDDYYYAPLENFSMVLPVTKDGGIVMVRQYKHGIGEIMIELPAGFKMKDLSHEQTAVCELDEEVGIKVDVRDLKFLGKYSVNCTKLRNEIYFYLAVDLEFNSTQHLDATEDIEILEIAPQKVLEMIEKGEIWAVETVACILRAKQKYPNIFR